MFGKLVELVEKFFRYGSTAQSKKLVEEISFMGLLKLNLKLFHGECKLSILFGKNKEKKSFSLLQMAMHMFRVLYIIRKGFYRREKMLKCCAVETTVLDTAYISSGARVSCGENLLSTGRDGI